MCSFAPFARPAGCFGAAAAPPPVALQSPTMAAYVEAPPHATTPRQMPPAEFPALSSSLPQDYDLEALLRGIRRVQVVAPTRGFFAAAPLAVIHEDDDAPTTPVAVLKAPISYGDDIHAPETEATRTDNEASKMEEDPSWAYDASIDAAFRKMERDPAERPSGDDYRWTTHDGKQMTMGDRAELVEWMYNFSRNPGIPPGTLHRAVNYVDRFMSANKIVADRLRLLGGAAVFAAAKYEDSHTKWVLNADDVAREVGGGCTRHAVLAAERELVAALGYRLGGPTAHTFVDHFTRHDCEGSVVRSVAHHLANITLLDYRCAPFLPSAVATSAILLARHVVDSRRSVPPPQTLSKEKELLEMARYTLEDLTGVVDAIYNMYELKEVWPGCALMINDCAYPNPLPRRL